MYIPVLIIGSGIAGMSVAYNLKKSNIKNLIITKENNYMKSNSTIAYANMRLFENPSDGIQLYMNECNGNYEMISNIYSNQNFLIETLAELQINVKKTPIGIIPEENTKLGGQLIVNKLFKHVDKILTDTILIDFKINQKYIECLVYNNKEKFFHINCNIIVFATGGYASIFEHNDNINNATGKGTYILHKHTKKLKGASTIMFHPFGVVNGKKSLTGDIVSFTDNIYYKDKDNSFKVLNIDTEVLEAIKQNKYHNNKMFEKILSKFYGQEIYLKLRNDFDVNTLKKEHISNNLMNHNLIHIQPTAHYTSGGIFVDKNFKVQDRIFANGEIVFDGNKGIGRIPGHAFTSAIVGGKIIADEISKADFEFIEDNTSFEIEKKISKNDEHNYSQIKEIYDKLLKKVETVFWGDNNILKIESEIKQSIEYTYNNLNSVRELMIFYRMNLLYEIIKDLKNRN